MPDGHLSGFVDRWGSLLRRIGAALGLAMQRWDGRVVLVGVGAGYFLLYLVTIGDVSLFGPGGGPLSVRVAADLSRAFAPLGFFRFGSIAVVRAGGVTVLVSPLNIAVALVLAGLVAANMALTYLGLIQPQACGLQSSTGALAGIPALFSGAACCGPTFLLAFGIQATGALITVFQVLVPVAVVLLVGGLLVIGRSVEPERIE